MLILILFSEYSDNHTTVLPLLFVGMELLTETPLTPGMLIIPTVPDDSLVKSGPVSAVPSTEPEILPEKLV